MSDIYEFCKALTDGFQEALEDEGIEVLYQNYLLLNTSKVSMSKTAFVSRELRGSVVNQLMDSEYQEYFAQLTLQEMAELLNVKVKKFNADYTQIHRKLVALQLKGFRGQLEDMVETLELTESTSQVDGMEAPSE